jgi:hypothetical protein
MSLYYRLSPIPLMSEITPVRPSDATSRPVVRCSGHIDRSGERYRDNPAGVFKLTAIKVHFLAVSEIS